ncbi:MAG: EAL domain-containing protein [Candidatus Dormibacteria bacterium]
MSGEAFFDLALDLLAVVGTDGYFKLLNPAWERSLGWSGDELMRRPYLEFVHSDDRDATVAEASKVAAGLQTMQFRNRYRCKDGSYKWLAWTATAAMADGVIYAGARDVTATVHAEEEERRRMRETLDRIEGAILQPGFGIAWQPIVSLPDHAIKGFEALSRFHVPPPQPPDRWFAEAETVGLRSQLELCAMTEALKFADVVRPECFISLNASPDTLCSAELGKLLSNVDPARVVVEVTEHAVVDDYDTLTSAANRLRSMGIRLAIDDAGAGFASLSHVVRLLPDFIKLDSFLTRNVDHDRVKRALAAALARFAREIGAQLIAEGVETETQLRVVEDLGVDYAQGFLLGTPAPL